MCLNGGTGPPAHLTGEAQMPKKATRSVARTGKLITKSMFSGYDTCLNPYVGCEFGCSYCYVRFSIKDDQHAWGEFVRVREHMADRLPRELDKGYLRLEDGHEAVLDDDGNIVRTPSGKPSRRTIHRNLPIPEARLVIGTMTDPYQPAENQHHITRTALEILANHPNQFQKVGIFTRSPLIVHDLELIKRLPKARVHFTITPFPPDILRAIEPYSSLTKRRWEVVKAIKDAGIFTCVNVSPIIPLLSDGFEEEFVQKLIELQIDEYFVDPMQPYKEAWEAFKNAAAHLSNVNFREIERIMLDRDEYLDWKFDFLQRWNSHREPIQHLAPTQLPIWSDHEHGTWVNMLTGEQMSKRVYGDEA